VLAKTPSTHCLWLIAGPACRSAFESAAEYDSPDAAATTVLVTGATGRVGRVLVRKLLLRGYKVRALVRQRDTGAAARGSGDAEADAIPQSAELVFGDIADYGACRNAVEGVDKVGGLLLAGQNHARGSRGLARLGTGATGAGPPAGTSLRRRTTRLWPGSHRCRCARPQVICCSGARSTLAADLSRVEEQGVTNLARAFLDAQVRGGVGFTCCFVGQRPREGGGWRGK
jgi:NAD(P)-dependent dehydrogenase (short-subunit alcohol dehydrogenase family)